MKSKYHNDEFYRNLLVGFVSDLPITVAQINDALRDHEYKAAESLTHRLAGTAATYGYPELAKTLVELEKLLKAGQNQSSYPGLMTIVEDYVKSIREAL